MGDTFYESDCQGQFFSSLIAFSCFLWQSAPSDPKPKSASDRGWAEQSYAADSCPCARYVPLRRFQATDGDHKCRPRFYLRLTRVAWRYRFFWSSERAYG